MATAARPSDYTPTTDELHAAWQRAGLWRTGWSFERANATPVIRHCLVIAVQRTRHAAADAGHPLPHQPALL